MWCECSAEFGLDWRGAGHAAVAAGDACRSYPAGQMPAMNGVVQRRQMTYNAAAAGVTGYNSAIKQEYPRAVPPKYVISLVYYCSTYRPLC